MRVRGRGISVLLCCEAVSAVMGKRGTSKRKERGEGEGIDGRYR